MDTNQLSYFIAVAQTLSFSEAARRCSISQPAISHSISELEKQLGTKLFIRSRKGVSITDTGKLLLPDALQIISIAEKAAFRIHQMESGDNGHLSISALTTSSSVVSDTLAEFSRRYPNVTVDITFTSGRTQVLTMNESKYDFHFATDDMVPKGDMFDVLPTHRDQLCMVFPDTHPMADQPLDFSKLKNERFIIVSETDGPALYSEIHRVCRSRGYTPNIVCKYDRAEAVLLSVGAGSGISIIPEALSRVFYSEHVKFVRIPGNDTERTYVVAWHKTTTNPAATLFREVVMDLYQNKHKEG